MKARAFYRDRALRQSPRPWIDSPSADILKRPVEAAVAQAATSLRRLPCLLRSCLTRLTLPLKSDRVFSYFAGESQV